MAMPRAPDTVLTCQACGKGFRRKRIPCGVFESYSNFLQRKFCSRPCKCAGQKVASPKRGQCSRIARRIVGKKPCEVCGATKKVHVHHKNEDWSDNRAENLQALCAACHNRHHNAERSARFHAAQAQHCLLCEQPPRTKGYCNAHYHKLLRYGDASAPNRKVPRYADGATCKLCDKKIKGHGLCPAHLYHFKKKTR